MCFCTLTFADLSTVLPLRDKKLQQCTNSCNTNVWFLGHYQAMTSGVSVCPSVRKPSKFFWFPSNLVWVDLDQICVPVWPRPYLRSRSRSFRSCENCTFLGLSTPPFWCEAQNYWWLVVIIRDLDYSLSELIFEFPSRKLSQEFYTYCVCWCDLDPIHGPGQGHGAFEVPTTAHNCTFVGLSPPPLLCAAQSWWLVVIVWDLVYSLLEPDLRISF